MEELVSFFYWFHHQRRSNTLLSLFSFTHSPFFIQSVNKKFLFHIFRTAKKSSDTPSFRFKWQVWIWSKYFSHCISFFTWIYLIFSSLNNNKYIAGKQSQRQLLNKFYCSEEKNRLKKKERNMIRISMYGVRRAAYNMYCLSLFLIYLCEMFGVRSVRMCYYYYLFRISFPVVTTDPVEWLELNNANNKCKSCSYSRRSIAKKSCYLTRNCFSLYVVALC